MRKIVLLGLMLCAQSAYSEQLFTFDNALFKNSENSAFNVVPNAAITALKVGDRVDISLPNAGALKATIRSRQTFANNVVSMQLSGGSALHATLSQQGSNLYGTIQTQTGLYRIDTIHQKTILYTPSYRRDVSPVGMHKDALLPPSASSVLKNGSATAPPAAGTAEAQATIDILFVYTADYARLFGGGLNAQLQNLIVGLNGALSSSQISGRFRLVHAEPTAYSNNESSFTALDAITNGTGEFSNIGSLRLEKGADLVVLLRRFTNAHFNRNLCGLAWINGAAQGEITTASSPFGFSIVQQGDLIENGRLKSFCGLSVLAHEIGHNMGLEHDAANQANAVGGVFPYSNGYALRNILFTIMATDFSGREQLVFSNPNIRCAGRACGIAGEGANGADAARSMRNVFGSVARFTVSTFSEPRSGDQRAVITPVLDLIMEEQAN